MGYPFSMEVHPLPPSPEELLEKVGGGCQDSFSDLHGRYRKTLHGIASAILCDPSGADDIVQDSFVSIWDSAGKFDPALGNATAWMIRITRNTALDALRRNKTRLRYMDTVSESVFPVGHQPSPCAALMASERAGGVGQVLNSLSFGQRQVLLLAYYDGLSQTEIADKLEEPVGTVKSRIRRAIRQMRCMVGVPRF